LEETSDREQSPRLTQSRIFAIALVVLLLPLGIYFGTVSGGGTAITGCNSPASLEQCGTGSCIPSGTPVLECNIVVTFSPAFAAVPKYASAQLAGCHTPECHNEVQSIPSGTLVFQSDNGETWANMPIASTEIYGNTNHEVGILTTPVMNTAQFMVGCLTGSASATATLRPQYSIDGGGTWNELSQNPGGLDILVDASDCSFSASPAFVVGPVGIAAGAVGTSIITRVVGFNGNGVGDNVVFNNVELVFFSQFSEIYNTCIPMTSPWQCPSNTTPVSKTTMTISVIRLMPAISGTATSILVNWMASE
jgi:hypothetical protein